jgi:fructose-1,6-bisphosphatase/inositol monophosphatase family enzyme
VPLSDSGLLELLHDTADAISSALGTVEDWGHAGDSASHAGQHHSDRAADAAALKVLAAADVAVLSEESGHHDAGREITVVVDPLDGSTNASRGIPWYAISLCALDGDGPRAALVVDVPHGWRYQAVRGGGAFVDGRPLRPSGCIELGEAVVGLSGFPKHWLGWKQYRALGAAALDLCAVAQGTLDAYVDCSWSAHGVWDYLGGLLICQEAGAVVGDAEGRELVVLEADARRTPLAAATPELYRQVAEARATTN